MEAGCVQEAPAGLGWGMCTVDVWCVVVASQMGVRCYCGVVGDLRVTVSLLGLGME